MNNIYTYPILPHQIELLNEVKGLDLRRLHYLVIQQDRKQANLTLNELKKHIKRGIKLYVRDLLGSQYKYGIENKIIEYVCFFETSKEFFWSQNINSIVDEDIEMNLHFHLFISSTKSFVHIPQLINYIIHRLTSQRNKLRSTKLIDYVKMEKIEDDFVLYHTKQMMYRKNKSFYLSNFCH
jgi:hypothetical protein